MKTTKPEPKTKVAKPIQEAQKARPAKAKPAATKPAAVKTTKTPQVKTAKPKAAALPKPKPKPLAKEVQKPVGKSPETINEILDQIMDGQSLRSICESRAMPHIKTVLRWLRDDPEFFEQYRKAQEVQAEMFVDEVIDLSKKAVDKDTATSVRIQIDAIKYKAGKQKPKRFGDRLDVTSDGEKITRITYEIVHAAKNTGKRDTNPE